MKISQVGMMRMKSMEIELNKEEVEYIISWARATNSEYGLDDVGEWELFQRFLKLNERLEKDASNGNQHLTNYINHLF